MEGAAVGIYWIVEVMRMRLICQVVEIGKYPKIVGEIVGQHQIELTDRLEIPVEEYIVNLAD